MDKEKIRARRNTYLTLADIINHQLCSFCKFNYSDVGGESPCDCGDPSCHHPLAEQFHHNDYSYGLEPGDDCWGFRQGFDIALAADIVGVCLTMEWQGFTCWQNKKGQWKITEWRP